MTVSQDIVDLMIELISEQIKIENKQKSRSPYSAMPLSAGDLDDIELLRLNISNLFDRLLEDKLRELMAKMEPPKPTHPLYGD